MNTSIGINSAREAIQRTGIPELSYRCIQQGRMNRYPYTIQESPVITRRSTSSGSNWIIRHPPGRVALSFHVYPGFSNHLGTENCHSTNSLCHQ
ncbi:hypothetical protein TNCT_366631 [Trichonephila clavata]|uniref:Uncharacterized protein n=1 Tax=Trichonephila clavata TaxID=2740835 RepID=A0A8X6H0N4_TRICU|nr:hypothetical protein TNCT_366631 [Trichonephila clavata]